MFTIDCKSQLNLQNLLLIQLFIIQKQNICQEESLDSVTKETTENVYDFESITSKQLEILEKFCEGGLLEWITTNMKGGPNLRFTGIFFLVKPVYFF